MKLVVALALLSNAAAFLAPAVPRAATQLKAITTEVRSRVRDDVPSNSCTLLSTRVPRRNRVPHRP